MYEFDKGALLETVFDHYDIVHRGRRGKCLCPVHSESTASAVFDLDTGWWECFACTKRGDGLTIIMERERVSFLDAAQFAQGILDGGSSSIRAGASGKSGTGVSGSSRDQRRSRRYIPSWVRPA